MGDDMGVGLRIGADVSHKPWLENDFDRIEFLCRLRDAIAAHSRQKQTDLLLQQFIAGAELLCCPHPAAEDVTFSYDDDRLICSAKTSTVGPGYHAYLVEMLEDIGRRCDLPWEWSDEGEGFGDDAGYHGDRSFDRIQDEMCWWLRAVANSVLDDSRSARHLISMRSNFGLAHADYFAASATGFWDRDFFEKAARRQPDTLHGLAARFFPWWSKNLDARFWRNAALVLMWERLTWSPPENDAQRAVYELTLTCLSKARQLDPFTPLPEAEAAEIRALLSKEQAFPIPEQGRIGFRRLDMRRDLAGDWSVVTPGYFYKKNENDTVIYWYGDRFVHGSSLSFTPDIPNSWEPGDRAGGALGVFTLDEDGRRGSAVLCTEEESEQQRYLLFCKVHAPGSLCLLSIYFRDINDLDWARLVFESACPDAGRDC
jgi:hypothetical protein